MKNKIYVLLMKTDTFINQHKAEIQESEFTHKSM